MSASVTLSIATNAAIAASKVFGWIVTGSPTLFAEMVHSFADVGNQVLLRIGEVRSKDPPSDEHPFGTAQVKFFWALVSAVSIFFVGCGVNVYHGVQALLHPQQGEPFSTLVLALLVIAFFLEGWTFLTALREMGGFRNIRENRHNTTVLAVLLEDSVALTGIVLTLVVGASSRLFGANAVFDAVIAIVVGVLLGAAAIVLAAINGRLLVDTSDLAVNDWAQRWLRSRNVEARVRSIVLDHDRVTLIVRVEQEVPGSFALGQALTSALQASEGVHVDNVYWKFATPQAPPAPPG